MTTTTQPTAAALKPFTHDCDKCVWVGWMFVGARRPANLYFCPSTEHGDGSLGTIILRFSDTGSDYWSNSAFAGTEPHSIGGLSLGDLADLHEAQAEKYPEDHKAIAFCSCTVASSYRESRGPNHV